MNKADAKARIMKCMKEIVLIAKELNPNIEYISGHWRADRGELANIYGFTLDEESKELKDEIFDFYENISEDEDER